MSNRTLKFIFSIVLIFFATLADGQVIVDNSITETEAVEDILLGAGVEVFNISFTGESYQIGSFDSNGSILPISNGVILGSGNVNLASGADFDNPDTPGPGGNTQGGASLGDENSDNSDADLAELSGQNLNDLVVLEFDFIPQGDSLKFEFVFGSEEYNEFVGDVYNDAFGFFLSGPGINGTFSNNAVNLALVPGTNTPVTINTINLASNSDYFINNETTSTDPNVIEYDGFTAALLAESEVQCGELYHIKMVLADGFDGGYDSAVFLEASSFSSNLFNLELVQDIGFSANDSTLFENCGESIIRITRPESLIEEQTLTLELDGTAENGIDFEGVPTDIFFAENQSLVEIPLTIFQDNIDEPIESLSISFETQSSCNSVSNEFTVYIIDIDPISIDIDDAASDCNTSALLVPEVTGGVGNYTYLWDDGTTTLENEVSPGITTSYILTVSDDCNVADAMATSEVTVPLYPPINLDDIADLSIYCGEEIDVITTANGGSGNFEYEWELDGTILGNDQNLMVGPPYGGTISATATDGCGLSNSTSFELLFTPISVNIGSDLVLDCLSEFEITPLVDGDYSDYSFEWESNEVLVSNSEIYSNIIYTSQSIGLTITDACNEEAYDEILLTVPAAPITVTLPEDFGICLNESAEIIGSASGGIGELTFRWEDTNRESADITITPDETQSYTLVANDVCENIGEESITVFVEDLTASFSFEMNEDDSIDFTNSTENAIDYLWDLSEEYYSTEYSLTHSFDDIYEQHLVTLYATSELGCIDSTSHIFEPPTLLYVPAAFTPDGDGLNEKFTVIGSSISSYNIVIFDRDGHIVYESNDILEYWDGSNKKGDYYVQNGVYSYFIKVETLTTEVIERYGHITILR